MTEHPGAGALRVEIDHEHPVTSESSRGGQAKSHRGLADATLLVQQRRDTPRRVIVPQQGARDARYQRGCRTLGS
ncbi:MAG: hypothetical protein QOJ74_1000 [Ilumatobacteraceae bacterium]|nr:hypothetical protein [Ilumatobacteraceae bacterium]